MDQFGMPPSRTPGRLILPRGVAPRSPRIWTPKFKIKEAWDPVVKRVGIEGFFQLRAIKRDGVTVARESARFHNLITDNGLNSLASNISPITSCFVGTGNTAPNVSDTALVAEIASTSTIQANTQTRNSSSPYDMHVTKTYRFGEGVAEGNLAELGVGDGSSDLFSRELIRDGMGSPTTFPVASDEYLDVTYEIVVYPPLVDDEDTITITGSGSHDTTLRAKDILGGGGAWQLQENGIFAATQSDDFAQVWDGAIGAITGSPSGSTDGGTGSSALSYTPGNFFRDCQQSFGLADGNFGGGILSGAAHYGTSASVFVSDRSTMRFQCQFDPVIAKTASDLLTLTYRMSWARV